MQLIHKPTSVNLHLSYLFYGNILKHVTLLLSSKCGRDMGEWQEKKDKLLNGSGLGRSNGGRDLK